MLLSEELKPDVLVLDGNLPKEEGLEMTATFNLGLLEAES